MKKLLIGVAIAFVVIIAGLAALVLLINPNQFKPLIVEQTKNATGLDLVIEGDIGWQFFPTLGFAIGKTEMRNPDGFEKQNLFQVNTIDVSIELLPLFDKQLTVGKVMLNGADIQLETLNNGRTNLDSFTATDASSSPLQDTPEKAATSISVSSPETQTDALENDWQISIAGLSIKNSNLEVNDRKTGATTRLQVKDLSISEFTPGEWSQVAFDLAGDSNGQQFALDGSSEFTLSKNLANYALRNVVMNAAFDDGTNKISNAKLVLNQFELGQPAEVTITLEGLSTDMTFSVNAKTELWIDPALTSIKASNLSFNADVKGAALPQSPMKLSLMSDVTFDRIKNELSATVKTLSANDIALDGTATVALADVTKVRFNLHSKDIDVDKFLGLEMTSTTTEADNAAAKGATQPTNSTPTVETEPDLSVLKTLDVAGTMAIDKLKASNVDMSNIKTTLAIHRGVVTLDSFSANLYQGTVVASGQLDSRKSPATYQVKKTVKGVQIKPLLYAAAQTDLLEGTGNLVATLSGKSLAPTAMKQNITGVVDIELADGAINGMNIAQQIRTARATLKGKSSTEVAERKTDFSALTATLTLDKGKLSTDNLAMQSPLLRIRGKGNTNYIKETLNFWLDASVVGALEGQGGADVDELKDLTIPVEVKGTWSEPNIDIALDVVLKQRAKQQIDKEVSKLQDKIESKISDEKTKETLNKLLKNIF
jgi:AsmA protein